MSLLQDSIDRNAHHAAGTISAGGACPYCDSHHGPDIIFCPDTGMALPGARDEFCGSDLAGGITVVRPIRRTGPLALYEGRSQEGLKAIVKRLLPPRLEDEPSDRPEDVVLAHGGLEWEGHILSLLTDLNFVPRLLSRGQRYLAMEWVEGPTLEDWIQQSDETHSSLNLEKAIDCCLALISSVRILHGRRVYHRAIEAHNILLRESDARPVLVGFTAAVSFGHKDAPMVPRPGARISSKEQSLDPDTAEAHERERDLLACREITCRVLSAARSNSPEIEDRSQDDAGESSPSSLPEPVAKALDQLLDGLQSPGRQSSLATLTSALESLRIQVERHLQEESDGGPSSLPPAQTEETQPVTPLLEQTDALSLPQRGEATKPWPVLVLGALVLAGLAGLLWHFTRPTKQKEGLAQNRVEASSAGSPVHSRDAGRPPAVFQDSGTSRPSDAAPLSAQGTVPHHHAGMARQAKLQPEKQSARQRPESTRHRPPARRIPARRGTRPRPPRDEEFIHAVDKAPEDL